MLLYWSNSTYLLKRVYFVGVYLSPWICNPRVARLGICNPCYNFGSKTLMLDYKESKTPCCLQTTWGLPLIIQQAVRPLTLDIIDWLYIRRTRQLGYFSVMLFQVCPAHVMLSKSGASPSTATWSLLRTSSQPPST